MMSTTLTIRIDEETKSRLDTLARATTRSKSYLVSNAIEEFLKQNEWHIQEIRKTVAKADKPDARFADHEDVASWLRTWGTDKELDPPK